MQRLAVKRIESREDAPPGCVLIDGNPERYRESCWLVKPPAGTALPTLCVAHPSELEPHAVRFENGLVAVGCQPFVTIVRPDGSLPRVDLVVFAAFVCERPDCFVVYDECDFTAIDYSGRKLWSEFTDLLDAWEPHGDTVRYRRLGESEWRTLSHGI